MTTGFRLTATTDSLDIKYLQKGKVIMEATITKEQLRELFAEAVREAKAP